MISLKYYDMENMIPLFQGLTMKMGSKMALHWNKDFQPGMAYVMLSRTQALEDIDIIESKSKFSSEAIKVNTDALEENNRIHDISEALKKEKELLFSKNYTVSYLNVRRLRPHLIDVTTDPMLIKSDVMCLGETWLKPHDTAQIDGFRAIEIKSEEDGKGLSAYIPNQQTLLECQKFEKDRFSAILVKTLQLDVLFVYLSKGFEWEDLKQILELFIQSKKDLAVIGDTNINFLTEEHDFTRFMTNKRFIQMIQEPTHERGGLLDQIYINESLSKKNPICSQKSVYYSDHDIICLHVPKE